MIAACLLALRLAAAQASADGGVEDAAQPSAQSQRAMDAAAVAQEAAQAAATAAEAAVEAAAAAKAAAALARSGPPPPASPPPPPPPPPAATAQAPGKKPSWSSLFGAGVIWLQGNSNTLTFNANAQVTHDFSDGWIVGGKANATYGTASAAGGGPEQVTALAAAGQLRADRVLPSSTSVYALGGVETDHVASLELRYYGELGGSVFWIDEKRGDFQKALLRLDLGFRVAEDDRWTYYPVAATATAPGVPNGPLPDVIFVGPRFGVGFRYALNPDEIFTEDASVQENIDGEARTLVGSTTKLASRIAKHLSIAVSFILAYDSEPAAGKVPTDTGLTIGIEGSF